MLVSFEGQDGAGKTALLVAVRDARAADGIPSVVVEEFSGDLYYQDEREIAPALEYGHIVLKDRHLDTILCTLTPSLVAAGAVRDESRALTWLSVLCSELRHRPALTAHVDAALPMRPERIRAHQRHLREDRANEVSPEDLAVFAARERISRQLIAEESGRFLVLDNSNRSLIEGTATILEAIRTRLAQPEKDQR